jgi:predicted pyridoxine 5'-phosphate oxidase superfamily flavin-nucleotide-binding protein
MAETMGHRFAELAFTDAVRGEQSRDGSRAAYARHDGGEPFNHRLGAEEAGFIAARDTLFIATVGETGWPYVQHRGGPPGFIRVADEHTLVIPEARGNRQFVTIGNLAGNDRVALLLIDFARRRRLKLLARARRLTAAADPSLVAGLAVPGWRARIEAALVMRVEAFDWNCPQHITPRFTAAEVEQATRRLADRVVQLEAALAEAGIAVPA